MLCRNSRFNRVKYTTNLKNDDILEEPKKVRSASIIVLLIFHFIKDIIDNIIYTSVLRDQNSHKCQCGILVMCFRRSHVIMIVHCNWWEFWSLDTAIVIIFSIISLKNEKLLNSNNNGSKPKFLRLLWDIVVFRLVVYLLNMIRLNLIFLYKILFM